MKAADIPDVALLAVVDHLSTAPTPWHREEGWHWVLTYDIEDLLPHWPPRVVLAKAKRLIVRGTLDGCWCGCRGDFRVTQAGYDLMESQGVVDAREPLPRILGESLDQRSLEQ